MWWYVGVLLLVLLIAELIRSAAKVSITRREIFLCDRGEWRDGYKLCHLSDLHLSRWMRNGKLEKLLLDEMPDCIVISGDLIDCHYPERQEEVFHFLRRICGKIPVVCSLGNHEARLDVEHFAQKVQEAGAVLLENRGEYRDGCYWYGYLQPLLPAKNPNHARLRQKVSAEELTAALGNCPKDAPVLLLAHDPALFPVYAAWGADLTFSGHLHGGAIRVPFLGGVLSPARKFFPRYDAGLFRQGNAQMLVSRGLAYTEIPRFCNPREIAFVTLRRKIK